MRSPPRPWSVEEDAFLLEHLADDSVGQIASQLGRTYKSVRAAMARLDVSKRPRHIRFPLARDGYRYCIDCRREQPVEVFNRHRHRRSGYQERCRDCRMRIQRRQLYGISAEEYMALLVAQDGACAICGQLETSTYQGRIRRLAVDHDHETGEVRGLLCSMCNRMIGVAQEDPDRLAAGAEYVKRARALGKTSMLPQGWAT